jgi:predicted transcriptional regulator
MAKSATLTLRVSEELKGRLGELAEKTQRTPSALANRALTAFVDHELEIMAGIERSLEDVRQGRTVSHEDAMKRVRATVAKHTTER